MKPGSKIQLMGTPEAPTKIGGFKSKNRGVPMEWFIMDGLKWWFIMENHIKMDIVTSSR